MPRKRKKKRRLKVLNVIKLIISIIMLLLSVVCFIYVNNLNVLPDKYLLLFTGVLFFLNIVATLLLFTKGIIKTIFGFIIYFILAFISIVGIKYISNTIEYFDKGFSNHKVELTTYNVIVLNNSEYAKIEDLENTKMGYLFIEINNSKYLDTVKKKVDAELVQYDVYELYNKLIDKEIESIVINDGYISLIEEEFPDFGSITRVLETYEIEVKVDTKTEKINKLKPVNIYLSGTDSRSSNISSNGTSDVNMIITINPDTHKILLTNIPRDFYVQLHGTTGIKDKLTHAGFYGIEMSKNTIEDFMEIDIDYSVKVGFRSVINLVDLVGGIDIYSDISFLSHCGDGGAKNVYVKKGWNHFDGAEALSFARERNVYLDGDKQRGKNQQEVIKAIFTKMISNKSLLLKYDSLLNEFSKLYRTDIPSDFITLLIKHQFDDMPSWSIETQSVDGYGSSGPAYSAPGYDDLYIMIPYEDTVVNAKNKINETLN